MTLLLAVPETIVIDRNAGLSAGKTFVTYSADKPGVALWERIVGAPWTRVALAAPRVSSPKGDLQRDGEFSQALEPGQVYQVVMYQEDDTDPNDTDPNDADPNGESRRRGDALVTVIALLKDPENKVLIIDQAQNIGGTWFEKVVSTVAPTSFMLQVSNNPSFIDAQGLERFLEPLGTVFGADLVTLHDRLLMEPPLLPGNDLFYLARVVDAGGNWQGLGGQIRTKQRRVTIHFDTLHIINDGALNETTANFHIWVMEGMRAIQSYFFGGIGSLKIWDQGTENGEPEKENIPLVAHIASPFVLGPKDVSHDTHDVSILTRGLCHRGVGMSNDWVNNFDLGDTFPDPTVDNIPDTEKFFFRSGTVEQMTNEPFRVIAKHRTDGEFEYEVLMRFSVDYL